MRNQQCSGFSLVETLVTLIIISVGLLGVVGMQVAGIKNNQSAYYRTQATILASDMADRLRFNSDRAADYNGFNTTSSNAAVPSACAGTLGCSDSNLVTMDKAEWTNLIKGTNGIVLLPNATGSIALVAGTTNRYTITVNWNETNWDTADKKTDVISQSYSLTISL
jgi:type IV pilus assembly protein PilV